MNLMIKKNGLKQVVFFNLLLNLFLLNGLQAQSLPYLILTSVTDTSDPWHQAVHVLKEYRNAEVMTFNPDDVDAILEELKALSPRYVAVIVRPTELHINFIRQFLMMSTRLDEDPFSDFSYGYITGATAQDALNFVNSIIMAEMNNIQGYPLNIGGYAASSLNFVFTLPGDYLKYLEPPTYSAIYLETDDSGSGRDFFLANTSYMMNNKLLDIGYNGDPHMLWLFEGGNINPNPPVWNYDTAKIEDPAYARMGLTSYDIGALNLYPAVAFNGACHAGETKTVMVEGDIAATFGDTQGIVEFYTMSDGFSYALSILKTGITGYFAPCGANNANDQSEEVYNAFLYHEPLGDIQKRNIDGVVMGFLGNAPNLRIFVQGESTWQSDVLPSGTFDPDDWSGAYYMLGGKANRIYFGDPLFNPYAENHSDSLNITRAVVDSIDMTTLGIELTFHKPDASIAYFPVWDKFHYGNTRIYLPVELPAYCAGVSDFQVLSASGPYDMVIHAVEKFLGKTFLHIEVDIPDDMYEPIDFDINFLVTFLNANMQPGITGSGIKVFPNPGKDFITVQFPGYIEDGISLTLTSPGGQYLPVMAHAEGKSIRIDTRDLASGIYFLRIKEGRGCSNLKLMIAR